MKKKRHQAILNIIEQQDVETQEELAALLREVGFGVTQATVSRDIRQLGLMKQPAKGGGQRYVFLTDGRTASGSPYAEADKSEKAASGRKTSDTKYTRLLRESFSSMDVAQNLLVIRTGSGMAMAAAAALDAFKFPEVLGCIAGDDTIMVACRTMEAAELLMGRIRDIMNEDDK